MKIFNKLKLKIKNHFLVKKLRSERIKRKTEQLTSDYERLINEYRLIQEGTSKLSKRKRDFTILRIQHLISKGHIQIQN